VIRITRPSEAAVWLSGPPSTLLEEDPVAQVMVEGMMEGMGGEELREVIGLTKIAFASKRRLIRRRIDKAFPKGWTL
jgi:hypothetical protein